MHDSLTPQTPGKSWYFTVRLLDPGSSLLTDHIHAFGEAMRHVRAKKPFAVDAWVVLPDHVHAIWTLPEDDDDYASRWRAVKIGFTKGVHKAIGHEPGLIWEPLFLSRPVRGEQEHLELTDYIHQNPVRHALCREAVDWLWSSIHRTPPPPPPLQKRKKGPQALSLRGGIA